MSKDKEDRAVRFKSTPYFKLKDKQKRNFQVINLAKQFGFAPEVIIIEKLAGHNNALVVRAVLTSEEMDKEDQLLVKDKN